MNSLLNLIAILVGLGITVAAGWFTQRILGYVGTTNVPPQLLRTDRGGSILGLLEGIFFFGSLWQGAFAVIAGYLALKVASKWAAWQHIVKIPDANNNEEKIDLTGRNAAGSYLYSRFLIGTLYNWLCGAFGVVIGSGFLALFK